MNARILKKLSKRAVPLLVAMGYRQKDFNLAEATEPPHHEQPGLLKGTPLYWEQVSYECNEWDSKPAWEVLSDWAAWQGVKVDGDGYISGREKPLSASDVLRMAEGGE